MNSPLFNIHNYYFNPHSIPYFVSGILILAEAIFIFLQNKRAVLNISFAIAMVFAGIWLTGVGIIYSSSSELVAVIWSRYYCWLGIIFVTPATYFFSEAWKKISLRRNLKFIYINFLIAFLTYLICISSPYIVKGVWLYWWGFFPKGGFGEIPFIIWFYLLMVLSFKNFIESYRNEKIPIKKKQSKLVIIAFVFGFIGSLEFAVNFGIPLYTFAAIIVLFFTTTIAYTIINYKLLDIETVIHKTIAWFFTSVALVAPLATLLYFTKDWYIKLGAFATLSYFGVVLLCFVFFIKMFQPKVDHLFQRRRFDLEVISDRFTEDLVHLKGLSQLIQRIEDTIANTLYPQQIDIFIYYEDKKSYRLANATGRLREVIDLKSKNRFLQWLQKNNRIVYKEFIDIDPLYSSIKDAVKDYLSLTQAIVVIPLVLNEKLLSVINLGKKANLKRYSALDFHFLTTLKNQSTIAISNSLLYENMEEQVRERTKELVEVQKQLIQAEKMATVGTLAGGVAHEINNPLTAILTNVQMLLASDTIDDKLDKESLELIEDATKRCRTIVQKLMTYARKPLETTEMSKLNLLDIFKNVTNFLGYQLEQENIKIVMEAKKDSYLIMGNSNELEQVFTNLILNARDAIKQVKKTGSIYITFLQDDYWIKIDVKDEGIGIPNEISSKIFDPFFTTKDVGKGVGLGLSICQAIVEKHDGEITFESEVNKGVVFTIKLPRAEERNVKKGKNVPI